MRNRQEEKVHKTVTHVFSEENGRKEATAKQAEQESS